MHGVPSRGPLAPGRTGLVHYYGGVGDSWHERLLISQKSGTSWCICTPDDDVYTEDLAALMFTPNAPGRVPAVLAGQMVYSFSPWNVKTKEEWADLFDVGIVTAGLERAAAGEAVDPAADALAASVAAAVRAHGIQAVLASEPVAATTAGGALVAIDDGMAAPPGLPSPAARGGFAAAGALAAAGEKWRVLDVREGGGPAFGSVHALSVGAHVFGDTAIDYVLVGGLLQPIMVRRVADVKVGAVVQGLQGAVAAFTPAAGIWRACRLSGGWGGGACGSINGGHGRSGAGGGCACGHCPL